MVRFGFSIKTRQGQRVDHIQIMAGSADEAERRLRQMYHHCTIVERRENSITQRVEQLDVEDIIGLISGSPGVSAEHAGGG
jgi:hypothetical protein